MTQPAATAGPRVPTATAAVADLLRGLEDVLPGLRDLYKDLHSHPELSFQEVRTAGLVARRLRAAGWDVTDLDGTMADLRSRGITFEEYALPDLKTVNGVAATESYRGCWFKDTEGNILGMGQDKQAGAVTLPLHAAKPR